VLLRRALLYACLLALAPRTAFAVQYEVFVDAETEEDLYDLLFAQQISESTFEALLLLLQTRVELNRADREALYQLPNLDYADVDRIMGYRQEVEVIQSLDELAAEGVLDPRLAESVRPFVLLRVPPPSKSGADGFVRIQARWSGRHDRLPPPTAVQARIRSFDALDIGVVGILSRTQLRGVRWDSERHALSAEPARALFQAPKLYVEWRDDKWAIVGGTYRIGFGQRLTFDVTDQITPNGFFGDYELRRVNELGLACRRAAGEVGESPCSHDRVVRITPDYEWTNRLAGVAVGWKALPLGKGWFQGYAWGSYQVHRISQVEIVDAAACGDPRRDEEPACRAPPVYVRAGDPRVPASTFTFATLPAMYAEGLGGMNASYFWNARAHVGLTGYGSVPRWLVRGANLGFQETARKPFGGPFGAAGVNVAFGFKVQDFFAEVARSFDSQVGGGGGYAAIVRSITTLSGTELDASVRYYGPNYANPYARPISAPDELDGLRARDEAGLRLRATTSLGRRVALRTVADGWRRLSSGRFNGLLLARADLGLSSSWAWGAWAEYHNRAGQRFLLATQLAYAPLQRLTLSAQIQHRWAGDQLRRDRLQQDIGAILSVSAKPMDMLRLRLRVRYDLEDLSDNHRLPHLVWAYLEATLGMRDRDVLRMRYDFRVFLDHRDSTVARVPNPEHWLWVEYTFRF
jgi:hypothetical protein